MKIFVAGLSSGALYMCHLSSQNYDSLLKGGDEMQEAIATAGLEGKPLWSTVVDEEVTRGKVMGSTEDVTLEGDTLVFLGQLRYVKQAAMATVDTRAVSAIARGFTYKDHTFSLSIPAQMSLNGIFAVRTDPGVFPLSWPTADNAEIITIADQKEFVDFFGAAFAAIRGARDEAAYLKALIQAADSEEAVAKEIAQ